MDINEPKIQRKLKKFRRLHRWHRFVAIASLFFTIGLLASLGYLTYKVVAAEITLSLSISEAATTEPSEMQTAQSGGSSINVPPLPQKPPQDPLTAEEVIWAIHIGDSFTSVPVGANLERGSAQTYIPILASNPPYFFGTVSIPHALLLIEVHSDSKVTTVIEADALGNWSWLPPEPFEPGGHIFTLTIYDPDGTDVLFRTQMSFIIGHAIGQEVKDPVQQIFLDGVVPDRPSEFISGPVNPQVVEQLPAGEPVIFDVRVLIPDTHRFIQPGEELLSQVALINFSRGSLPEDVTLYYSIVDKDRHVLLEQSETVAVGTQLGFLKHFRTSMGLKPGEYQLIVKLPNGKVTAVSTDTFTVGDEPKIFLPGGTYVDVTITFQILISLIFLFLFILYFEFRRLDTLGGILRPITEKDFKDLDYLS